MNLSQAQSVITALSVAASESVLSDDESDELVDLFLALLRRDWAVRVLDAFVGPDGQSGFALRNPG